MIKVRIFIAGSPTRKFVENVSQSQLLRSLLEVPSFSTSKRDSKSSHIGREPNLEASTQSHYREVHKRIEDSFQHERNKHAFLLIIFRQFQELIF